MQVWGGHREDVRRCRSWGSELCSLSAGPILPWHQSVPSTGESWMLPGFETSPVVPTHGGSPGTDRCTAHPQAGWDPMSSGHGSLSSRSPQDAGAAAQVPVSLVSLQRLVCSEHRRCGDFVTLPTALLGASPSPSRSRHQPFLFPPSTTSTIWPGPLMLSLIFSA